MLLDIERAVNLRIDAVLAGGPEEDLPPFYEKVEFDAPMLEPVVYYRLARDANGERDAPAERDLKAVTRWWPDHRVVPDRKPDTTRNHPGFSTLLLLIQGDRVSPEQIEAAVDYCDEAIARYSVAVEPVEGRNQEAIGDFLAVRDLLTTR